MSYEDWIGIYEELPSRQEKLHVPNKSLLKCSDDETYLVEPVTLQEELNRLMKSVEMGRIFIRPSGTEDVVRIYAEARKREDVEALVHQTKDLVNRFFASCLQK
jgi:phosphoacetylglucosamine mutase